MDMRVPYHTVVARDVCRLDTMVGDTFDHVIFAQE